MRRELYWITGAYDGRLAIAPRPRGGDWLADELRAWQKAGLDVVVSLLRDDEVADLELSAEPSICGQVGLSLVSFPIPDRGVPACEDAFQRLVADLDARLRAGEGVGIHCRMGIGRSALLAASLLVRAGHSPSDAWATIACDRGFPVPDTEEQRQWLAARHVLLRRRRT